MSGWSVMRTYHTYPFPGMIVEKVKEETKEKEEKDRPLKKVKLHKDPSMKHNGKNLKNLYGY